MENTVQIIVMGTACSGKSTVSQEIVDALRNLGFAVKWEVKPDYDTELEARKTGLDRLNRLDVISDRATIVVKEVNVKKDFNELLNYRVEDHMTKKK